MVGYSLSPTGLRGKTFALPDFESLRSCVRRRRSLSGGAVGRSQLIDALVVVVVVPFLLALPHQ